MPQDAPAVEAIFNDALEIVEPPQRQAFLDRVCAGNAELRARVEALLTAHEGADRILKPPSAIPAAETPGAQIGRFKLLEQIGEGGFGVVFMAEQEYPIRRRVALKIIKLGMDTKQVVARFEAERQALAMMDHPSVAKVIDAGATETGRPYFVMELVNGIPVTEYCNEHHLTIRQRLELFAQICQAVQHAHQKGLIHRDLKPSNVLVTSQDDRPMAKVIDFGIAKATQAPLTEKTLFTDFRQLIGTPEYMSPEQAEGGHDMDTRCDVYSLGVVLYELLTGAPPFDPSELRSKAYAEIQRIIREVEPPRPSTRLSTLEALPTIAAQRATEPRRLGAAIRGELDWIVMRCLEKDRRRRYETASALADDVGRYLSDQPVRARPASRRYRLRKFIRRNKLSVFSASAVAAALILGLVFASIGFVRAQREAARADREADSSRVQAENAKRVTEFLQQMIGSAAPNPSRGPSYTVRQLLDDFADTPAKQLAHQPEVAATLELTVARAYSNLGEGEKAVQHFTRGLELRQQVFGTDHEEYADALVYFAGVNTDQSSDADIADGEARVRRALAIYRARNIHGERVIRALRTLGNIMTLRWRWRELEEVINECNQEARKTPDIIYPTVVEFGMRLSLVRLADGDIADAERIVRRTYPDIVRIYGPESNDAAWSSKIFGRVLAASGKFKEAFELEKRAVALIRKSVAADHQSLGNIADELSLVLLSASDAHQLTTLFGSPNDLEEIEQTYRAMLAGPPRPPKNYFDPMMTATRALVRFPRFYLELADEFTAAGRPQNAEVARQKTITLLDTLETDFADNPFALVWFYAEHIVQLNNQGKGASVEAVAVYERLRKIKLNTSMPYNGMAKHIATEESFSPQNMALAVELATKGVELSPGDGSCWNTLAIAQYRAGMWRQTLESSFQSTKLRPPDPTDWFYVAMARWQLGEREEARRSHDKAVSWMETTGHRGGEYAQLRAEAGDLMGLTQTRSITRPATTPTAQD